MGAIALDYAAMASVVPPRPESGLVKRAWLLLYSEGGWWSAAEIRDALGLMRSLQAVQSALGEMARADYIIRDRGEAIGGGLSVRYGVRRQCKVPRGVTIDEMWSVLQG